MLALLGIVTDDVPRKGNVDRNTYPRDIVIQTGGTFPARGTWIEIAISYRSITDLAIDVPRKGNVDRNARC